MSKPKGTIFGPSTIFAFVLVNYALVGVLVKISRMAEDRPAIKLFALIAALVLAFAGPALAIWLYLRIRKGTGVQG